MLAVQWREHRLHSIVYLPVTRCCNNPKYGPEPVQRWAIMASSVVSQYQQHRSSGVGRMPPWNHCLSISRCAALLQGMLARRLRPE